MTPILLFLLGCSQGPSPQPDVATDLRPKVRSHLVEGVGFSDAMRLSATLQAVQSAILSPKSPGRVERVNVRIGDAVKAGEILLEIDRSDYIQGLKEAEAAVALAEVQARQARSSLERFEALHGKAAVTDAQLEEVQAASGLADAQLLRAEAGQQVAENRLAETRLRAPFSGFVIARNVERGEMMGGPAQQPPIMLADLARVRAVASISETGLSQIREGMTVQVEVPALDGRRFEAVIERINHAVDPVVRTIQFEAVLDNEALELKHSMSAEVVLDISTGEFPAVPRSALLDREGSQGRVFLLEDGKVRSASVGYGRSTSDLVPILSGLETGQRILVAGHTRLEDGEEVIDVGTAGGGSE